MNNKTNWNYIFYLKAIINWVESIFLLLSDQWIRETLGETPLVNLEYSHLFLVLVFVIGIGYWWVGNDISPNLSIVKLGIIAQSSVFLVLFYHTWISQLHPFYLLPGIIDLTFAILFGIFLSSYTQTKPMIEQ